jgi:NADH-quinone oxidoreductase subunit J
MTLSDWLSTSENWVFLVFTVPMLVAGLKVVTTTSIVHAALYLAATLAGSAALLVLLGAEFVAWTVVLVSIGAVVVLFLFGIMVTRAPMGREPTLSHPRNVKLVAAVVSFALFALVGFSMIEAFGATSLTEPVDATRTADLGEVVFTRFVIPFEVVSVLLLAALIGGIVLARKDPGSAEGGL